MNQEKYMDGLSKEMNWSIKKNFGQQAHRYDIYEFTLKEACLVIVIIILISEAIAYLFYRSLLAGLFLIPLDYFMWKEIQKQLCDKRKRVLIKQFKDFIKDVSASLRIGYSVENAFKESIILMKQLYGEESYIVKEVQIINRGIDNSIPVEEMLDAFAVRTGMSDIMDFSNVFKIAKRSGGDMTKIISDTVDLIDGKILMDEEIQVQLSQRKLETRIMNLVPCLIIIYVSVTSPGFFECLYSSVMGRVVMSICLAVYVLSFYLSQRIINVEV